MPTNAEILRPAEARKIVGLGKSQFNEKRNPQSPYYDASFPLAVALGGRSVGFYRHELEAWLESRPRLTLQERQKRAIPPTVKAVTSRRNGATDFRRNGAT